MLQRVRGRRAAVLFVAGLALVALSRSPALAAPPTVITTCPYPINSPGAYVLGNNLPDCAGDAITISADDVTLDLKGFTIDGIGSGSGILVTNGSKRVRIANGSVTQFATGVEIVSPARDVFIRNMKLCRNTFNGVFSNGSSRISVLLCLVVENSGTGVSLGAGNEIHVCNNRVSRNGLHGISMGLGDGQRIICNYVSDHTSAAGIRLIGIQNSEIYGNTIERCEQGVVLLTANGNTLRRNRTSGNQIGILVAFLSTNNRLEFNIAFKNSVVDLADDNDDCDDNIWRNNRFGTRSQPCIQ